MKLSVLLMLVLFVLPARGQYIERMQASSNRFLSAGFLHQQFEPRYTNTQIDSLRIFYSRAMPALGFHQGAVDVMLGYTRYSLRGRGRASVFVGLTVAQDFPLVIGVAHGLHLRLLVSSDYTRAESNGLDRDDFVVGSAGLGVGLGYRFRQRDFELSISAAEAIHASFESFSTGIGFSAATLGELLLLLPDAVVLDGIALGYRFRYQTWSMNNVKFDYKALSHGAFVGVMF